MPKATHAPALFVTVRTVYEGEVSWWWTTDKLHDTDYHIEVNDKLAAKVQQLEQKYDVQNDTTYCCQWEGLLLTGESREQVDAAIYELARYLAKFKGLRPLLLALAQS